MGNGRVLGKTRRRRHVGLLSGLVTVLVATGCQSREAGDVANPSPVTPQTFADSFEAYGDGVVQVAAVSCLDEVAGGSGFLIAEDLVVTAAHVVDQAVTVGVVAGDLVTTADVIGFARSRDMALLRTKRPLPGHVFELAESNPRVGERVAALGYPIGGPLSMTQGAVSGLNREIYDETVDLAGLIQTDAAVNQGNSGGPLLDESGLVRGIVIAGIDPAHAEGIGLAIPAHQARESVEGWKAAPRPLDPASCTRPLGPSYDVPVPTLPPGPEADAIAEVLTSFFTAINGGDYLTAWELQTPARQSRAGSYEEFAEGHSTSYDTELEIHSVGSQADGSQLAYVTFVSFQSPEYGPEGEDCTLWSLDYVLVSSYGPWLIDQAVGHDGGVASRPCPLD